MNALTDIQPDFRKITDLAQRWAAYREGPFARDCADSIYEDAKARALLHDGYRGGVKLYADASKREHDYYRSLAIAAAGVVDHFDGEPDMECYIDEMEEVMWPDMPARTAEDYACDWADDRRKAALEERGA